MSAPTPLQEEQSRHEAPLQMRVTRIAPESRPARVLQRMLALEDFEPEARRILPRPIYGYVAGGTETDAALRGNRSVFDELSFVPRVLVNTAARDGRVSLFGRTYQGRSASRRWAAPRSPATTATFHWPAPQPRPTCR